MKTLLVIIFLISVSCVQRTYVCYTNDLSSLSLNKIRQDFTIEKIDTIKAKTLAKKYVYEKDTVIVYKIKLSYSTSEDSIVKYKMYLKEKIK